MQLQVNFQKQQRIFMVSRKIDYNKQAAERAIKTII